MTTSKERREERRQRKLETRLTRRETISEIGKIAGLVVLIGTGIYGATRVFQDEEEKTKTSGFISEYGEVVYQNNPEFPNRIYIVGQRHGLNILDDDIKKLFEETGVEKIIYQDGIVRTQLETYRIIGELIEKENVTLLLAEGAFAEDNNEEIKKTVLSMRETLGSELIDVFRRKDTDSILELLLEKTKDIFDATWLSGAIYDINIQGAESRDLHKRQVEAVNLLYRATMADQDKSKLTMMTDYLSEARSGLIFLNAPFVIEREIKLGRIKNRKAIIQIGNNHIDEMIRFADQDKLSINPIPNLNLLGFEQDLGYKTKGYGVTVIKPKSLLNN